MLRALSPGNTRAAACFAALVAMLGGAASARAAGTPGSWAQTALPSGTTTNDVYGQVRDQVVSSPKGQLFRWSANDGYPTLTELTGDGLGTPVHIPGAPSGGVPEQIVFLPNGDAVVSYQQFSTGPMSLVVRFANGTFGPTLKLDKLDPSQPSCGSLNSWGRNVATIAARPDEVLISGPSFFNVRQISVLSLSIAADGTLTRTADAFTPIYQAPGNPPDTYGTAIDATIITLDTAGTADALLAVDHISTSGDEIVEIQRDAAGTWSAPKNISSGTINAHFAGQLKAAVAPGGRSLAVFQTNDGTLTHASVYRLLREPGAAFTAPELVGDYPRPGGVVETTSTATGGDGTLALGVYSLTCNMTSASEAKSRSMQVFVAPPGRPVAGYGVGITSTAQAFTTFTSLGAGGGNAIVGLSDQANSAGPDANVCGQNGDHKYDAGSIGDRTVIVGPSPEPGTAFGSGTFNATGNGSVLLGIDAAGIDCRGNAAVTGRLVTSGVANVSAYGVGYLTAPLGFPAVCDGATPGTGGGTTTPDPATGGAAPSAGAPAATPPAAAPALPPAPVNRSATPTLSPPKLADGVLTFSLTAPHFSDPRDTLGERMAIQVFSGGSATALAARSSAKPKKKPTPKLIGTVSKSITLKSGQSTKVKLTLSPKLKKYLKVNKKALVVLTITSTQTGRTPVVTTRTIKH